MTLRKAATLLILTAIAGLCLMQLWAYEDARAATAHHGIGRAYHVRSHRHHAKHKIHARKADIEECPSASEAEAEAILVGLTPAIEAQLLAEAEDPNYVLPC